MCSEYNQKIYDHTEELLNDVEKWKSLSQYDINQLKRRYSIFYGRNPDAITIDSNMYLVKDLFHMIDVIKNQKEYISELYNRVFELEHK